MGHRGRVALFTLKLPSTSRVNCLSFFTMPQFMQSRCDFVDPAQLCSPTPSDHDYEMADHKHFENLHLGSSPPLIPLSNGGYLELNIPPKTSIPELGSNGLWPTSPIMASSGLRIPMSNFGLSPPSSSPSPPVEKTPGQSHKRRAQNRASYVSTGTACDLK